MYEIHKKAGAICDKVAGTYLAITPAGHLVGIPFGVALKPTFRYATQADVDAAKAAEAARSA